MVLEGPARLIDYGVARFKKSDLQVYKLIVLHVSWQLFILRWLFCGASRRAAGVIDRVFEGRWVPLGASCALRGHRLSTSALLR